MKKKVEIIILPSDVKTHIGLYKYSEIASGCESLGWHTELKICTSKQKMGDFSWYVKEAQHLYVLSDEEIQMGDLYLDDTKQIRKSTTSDKEYWNIRKGYKKIIATTDSSLFGPFIEPYPEGVTNPVPSLPQSFIELFVEEYNRSNFIKEIHVDYDKIIGENYIGEFSTDEDFEYKLKINSKNEITISIIKEHYTREEVITLNLRTKNRIKL
jgi:hypothetical protein